MQTRIEALEAELIEARGRETAAAAALREALEQHTATAEVLSVINSSPGDLAPVFQAMLQKAHTLCEASFGALMTYDGERFHSVAHQGTPAPFREFLASGILPKPGDPFGRMVEGAALSHIHDLSEVAARYPGDPLPRAAVDLGGIRTLLVVPLHKDGALLGVITAYRQEVRPFTDKQIALLQNFAAQAVIAMENARLITETREALEQQTATAEVLQVINSSPGDLTPVFAAILEKATGLCESAFGILATYDGSRFRHVALRNVPAAYAKFMGDEPRIYAPATGPAQAVEQKRVIYSEDLMASDVYRSGDPNRRAVVDLAGARTSLVVPLLKDDQARGIINVFRQEVRPFTDRQIALLENFAGQAVIAMENVRLLTETREALEQQTATAEVLQVINSSPGELAPVFDAMLEKGVRLCEASFGLLCTFDGERLQIAAMRGVPAPYAEFLAGELLPFAPGSGPASILAGARFHTVTDFAADPLTLSGDPHRRALVELGGARSGAAVPLRKDATLVGMFLVFRPEVQPFTEKQIALLENFAAQAVIAMENARLITETREALEQQTATAEVLQVINSSGDVK